MDRQVEDEIMRYFCAVIHGMNSLLHRFLAAVERARDQAGDNAMFQISMDIMAQLARENISNFIERFTIAVEIAMVQARDRIETMHDVAPFEVLRRDERAIAYEEIDSELARAFRPDDEEEVAEPESESESESE